MVFRHYIALVESETKWPNRHIWIAGDAPTMGRLMHEMSEEACFSDSPEAAETRYKDFLEDDGSELEGEPVVLEFKIAKDLKPHDIRHEDDCITVHDPDAVTFVRVWSGVIDDAFQDQIKGHELDEVALYGLKRCTAVTSNALLKSFHKPGITLGDVPETDVGVLDVLSRGGLSYKPVPMAVGRTVQQFASLNQRGAFYLVTPGHAMALINGELYDAENRGPDGRKIIQAYMISDR